MKKQLLKIPIIIFSLILLIFFYLLIIDRNPNEIPSNLLNKKIPNFQTASLLKKEIRIIGINYKDSPEKAKKWLKKLGNPYSNIPLDKNGKIAIDWGVYGIPETFIVNSKGIIRYRHVGQINSKTYKKINLLINEIE